jgi:hypothetical protein
MLEAGTRIEGCGEPPWADRRTVPKAISETTEKIAKIVFKT